MMIPTIMVIMSADSDRSLRSPAIILFLSCVLLFPDTAYAKDTF
jgi:hypothetical protein